MERFALRDGKPPQTYGLGVKELWEVPAASHQPGLIEHTVGWPLDRTTYGGSWQYHFGARLVSVGFVVGLDYANPWLSPFEEMQRFKTHPSVRGRFEGARRIAYGARALSEGGFQSLPKLTFPGGALIGDAAGFLNAPKIKGTHCAMKSGMLAAEAVAEALARGHPAEPVGYDERFRASWLYEELRAARNIRPSMGKFGLYGGIAYSALDTFVLRGRAPWTMHHHADNETLKPAASMPKIVYPKPDGVLTFDRLSSVFISNTNHEENQPVHLRLRDPARWESVNWAEYASPESRYCPAGGLRGDRDGGRPSPAADQRAELRPLQNLRHQGSDAEHRLGRAGGRRGAELSQRDVRRSPGRRYSKFAAAMTASASRSALALAEPNVFSKRSCAACHRAAVSRSLPLPFLVSLASRLRLSSGSTSRTINPSRSSGRRLCPSADRSSTREAANWLKDGLPRRAMFSRMDRWVERRPVGASTES